MRILLIMFLAIPSLSFGTEMFLWSDQNGIIESDSCDISYTQSSQVKIIGSTSSDKEIVRAHNADFNYQVYTGSLVSLIQNSGKQALVKVLTYQGQQKADQMLLAKHGSMVVATVGQLNEVSGRVLNLSGESHRVLSDVFQVESIALNLTKNHEGHKVVSCENQKYVVFDILDGDNFSKISEIGINLEHSTISRHIHFKSSALLNVSNIPTFGSEKFNLFAHIVCSEEKEISILNKKHNMEVFKAKTGETIVPFQKFKKDENSDDTFIYQKVKFSDRAEGENIGWILKKYIKLTSECPYIIIPNDEDGDQPTTSGYVFPLVQKPTHPYDSGMRKFGARRGGGTRMHAANDLYRKTNDAVVAVQAGKIIRPLYYFYMGTYAIEVKHDSGVVVRYGEINANKPAGNDLGFGARVNSKDIVGFIGKLNNNCCNPMLHFELYSGRGTGKLTVKESSGMYKRRWDLLDPTNYLKDWEQTLP